MNDLYYVMQGAAAIFAALIFAQSAWHKQQNQQEFTKLLEDYALLPSRMESSATKLLICLELIIALLLLSPLLSIGLIMAALLLAFYAVVMAITLQRGKKLADCGCGGTTGEHRLSRYQLIRNAMMIAMLSAAYFVAETWQIPTIAHWVIAFASAMFLYLLYVVFEQLNQNNYHKKQLESRYA